MEEQDGRGQRKGRIADFSDAVETGRHEAPELMRDDREGHREARDDGDADQDEELLLRGGEDQTRILPPVAQHIGERLLR
jgi:hypothetical protein